jgi:hypothetical protein
MSNPDTLILLARTNEGVKQLIIPQSITITTIDGRVLDMPIEVCELSILPAGEMEEALIIELEDVKESLRPEARERLKHVKTVLGNLLGEVQAVVRPKRKRKPTTD